MSFAPLAGVRVLDVSRLLPGPFLTQLFVDLGAEVIKVEEPAIGDPARWIPPDVDGAGHVFAAVNRGKRSIAIDLKADGASDIILRLCANADVFVDSFRPGVLDRLGLSDERLAAANPRLIRVALVGHGPGPLRDAPGHDINYEALAGILAAQGTPDMPMPSSVPIADLAGAMYASTGVCAALFERERTGRGQRIEVALHDAALAFNTIALERGRTEEGAPARGSWELGGALASYRMYACADGRFIALGTLEDKFWRRFIEAVERPEWEAHHLDQDPAFHAQVESLFRERARDAWVELLAPAGVPISPVLEVREAAGHASVARAGGRPGVGFPLLGAPSGGRAPTLGADADDILSAAGYDEHARDALRKRGVIP